MVWGITTVPILTICLIAGVTDPIAGAFGAVSYLTGSAVTFTAARFK